MDRRSLLRRGVAGAVAAAVGPSLARAASVGVHDEHAAPAPTAPTVPPFELEEVSVAELRAGMERGRWTAHAIAEQYLQRIAEVDHAGPTLKSVIEVNPDALAIADAMDAERKAGKVRGPLHGIPVLLKDNIDTADRMKTTAGSLALVDAPTPKDAFIAERLRAAGAVILGKTNLSEWANFRSSKSSSGWSGRGGQTKNPYVLDRNPCGSSSGSGAAVSASLAAIAVGTETDGSIVCPSSANGIVGIKPTVGLVSRSGIVPISHTQDTAGPMCRTVADAAALLTVLAGVDPRDRATRASAGHAAPDYTRFLDPAALRGARVGVARGYFGFSDAVDRAMREAIAAMRRAGATIVDPANVATKDKVGDPEFEVLLYEFKADLNAYLAARGAPAPVRTLAALIAWNEQHAAEEMPWFGQELFTTAEKKGPLTSPAYVKALAACRRLSRTEGIDATLAAHKLDAIVAPTGGPAWPTDLLNGDHFTGGSSTMAAVAGYPSVTIPVGDVHGLPVGLSFIGGAWQEGKLIRLAYALEQTLKARRAPRFVPTLGATA